MTTTPADSDPFFQLLTEALRAGPGSTQWGEAVAKLRDGGVEGADEFRLIIRAREDLEKGRDFRRITAGPGFTRKVLEAVEQEGGRRHNGIPTATIIAVLAGLVVVAVVVTGVVMMSGGGGPGTGAEQTAVARLEAASLPVSVASGSFPGPLNGFELSQDVASTGPTQPTTRPMTKLLTTRPLDPAVPAAVEAEVLVPGGNEPRLISLFVTEAGDGGGPAREIGVFYNDGRVSVDVGGRESDPVDLGSLGTFRVSIRFDREVAIIEAGGRRVYAGPHRLGDRPRHAGLRIVQPSGAAERLRVKSIAVAQAAGSSAGGR